jgi:hypothetical protein
MIRRLLTLLALLTGLAATGAQAELRLSGLDEVRLEARADSVSSCQMLALAAKEVRLPAARKPAVGPNYCPRPVTTIVIPTVMLGPDRAHE